jgi:hypothetical protein
MCGTGNSSTTPLDPELSVSVGMRAPRHAVAAGQLVLDIDDLHRLVGERPHLVLVLGQVGGRLRQHRVLAEHVVEIVDHVLGLLLVEAEPRIHHEVAHRVLHVVDAVAPALLVARRGRHPRLEAVARHAVLEVHLLAARLGQQLLALVHRDVAPAHVARLQREVGGEALVGAELEAELGVGLEAGRLDAEPVLAGRQVLDRVAALRVG